MQLSYLSHLRLEKEVDFEQYVIGRPVNILKFFAVKETLDRFNRIWESIPPRKLQLC